MMIKSLVCCKKTTAPSGHVPRLHPNGNTLIAYQPERTMNGDDIFKATMALIGILAIAGMIAIPFIA